MAQRYFSNAPATTLAASCSSLSSTVQVASTTGLPISYPFILILDRGTASEEVVLCTAAAGTTLTVTRGYDSTTAFAHAIGAGVVHGISAIDAREANNHVNANNGVHGATGSVVGTTDAQTLTNKNLTSGTNSFPTSLVTLTGSQTLTNKILTAPAATGSLADFGGAWTSYTPATSGVTLGSGTLSGAFIQIGKTFGFRIQFTLGAGSSLGSNPKFGLPAACTSFAWRFTGEVLDTGFANYPICGRIVPSTSTTLLELVYTPTGANNDSLVNSAAPTTFGSGDIVSVSGFYEGA